MKAVNPVSALTSAQQAAGAQPVIAGFRQPASQQGATPQGFSGQLANLAAAQPQGSAPSPAQSRAGQASHSGQTASASQTSGAVQAATQDQHQPADTQEQPVLPLAAVQPEVADDAAQPTTNPLPVNDPSGIELPPGVTTSALTELVKSYQSAERDTTATDLSMTSQRTVSQPLPTAATTAGSQSVSQEYQRLMANLSQNLSISEVRGLDTMRAEALKAAVQSGGSSSGAQISAQSLLDSRPDLLTANQRNPTVSEWAPIRLATQQPQHWGRDLMAALGDRLSMQVNQNVKEARIRLDPPELGRIEMTVRLDGDRLNIQLNASNHQVRDLLSQHADRLRTDLLAQNHQSVDVHVGQQNDQRDSHPGYGQDEILENGMLVAETFDTTTTEPVDNSWLSTRA